MFRPERLPGSMNTSIPLTEKGRALTRAPTLRQLLDAYSAQYRLCCRLKTDAAYTALTILRYRALTMAKTLAITLTEGACDDPTKKSILACIARCEILHTALARARDSVDQ